MAACPIAFEPLRSRSASIPEVDEKLNRVQDEIKQSMIALSTCVDGKITGVTKTVAALTATVSGLGASADGDQGPPGPPGQSGQDGDQGPRGPEGPAGADGPPGTPGQNGQDGQDGAPGATGADGTLYDFDGLAKQRSSRILGRDQFTFWSEPWLLDYFTDANQKDWIATGPTFAPVAATSYKGGVIALALANDGVSAGLLKYGHPSFLGAAGTSSNFVMHMVFQPSISDNNLVNWCLGLGDGTSKTLGIGQARSLPGVFLWMSLNGTAVTGATTGVAADSAWHVATIARTPTGLWGKLDNGPWADLSFFTLLNSVLVKPQYQVDVTSIGFGTVFVDHLTFATTKNYSFDLDKHVDRP